MKGQKKITKHKKVAAILPAILLLFTFLLFPAGHALGQSGIVTEQNLRDAILERKDFAQDQLNEMDLNRNDSADVADLVNLMKTTDPGTPVANFDQLASEAKEGAATGVRVNFSTFFSGVLRYSVSGTADSGIDYQALGGSVSVNGAIAEIPITVVDDLDLEEGETITITLESDQANPPPYIIGMHQKHTVRISENDSVWRGGLQFDNLSMGFKMEIAQGPSSYQAVLESDGSNGLPEGNWPVELAITRDTFSATIGPIQISEQDTLLGTAFERTIVLKSVPHTDSGHVSDLDSAIIGKMTDTLEPLSDSKKHLKRTVEGTFALVKEPTAVPVYEAELVRVK